MGTEKKGKSETYERIGNRTEYREKEGGERRHIRRWKQERGEEKMMTGTQRRRVKEVAIIGKRKREKKK